jgi:chromosome segregation ATPase
MKLQWQVSASRLGQALVDVRRETTSLLSQMNDTALQATNRLEKAQDEFINEFRSFSRTLLEQNHRAVVEALQEIVREFNKNLTEQFGDNFKQLNLAVGALLKWQENYRAHIENLEARIAAATNGVEASRNALVDIARETQKLPPAVAALGDAGKRVGVSVAELEKRLAAFDKMRESAVNAFPEIERNLQRLTEDFADSVKRATQASADAISGQHDALANQAEKLNDLFQAFDQRMQDELTRALTAMGQRLAGLNETFAENYLRFTKHFSEILPRREARQ